MSRLGCQQERGRIRKPAPAASEWIARWVGALTRAFALVGVLACQPSPSPDPPNFLLVSIDTLRRSSLRAFEPEAPERPGLDSFAAGVARLQSAYSTASWTLPAHASMLTGLFPDRHGAVPPDRGVKGGVFSLASELRRAGYRTVAFTEGGYLAKAYGLDRGFEHYGVARERTPPDSARSRSLAPFERAAAFLTSQRPDAAPFFMLVQTYRVHGYFEGRPGTVAQLASGHLVPDRDHALDCLKGRRTCSGEEWNTLEALYSLEVDRISAALDRLLALLEERPFGGSTYVFVVSDHGEGFQPERGRISHGGRVHEDVVRIPMLVAGPGVSARDVSIPVSLVDLPPTILDFAGLTPPNGLDGISLAEVLQGGRGDHDRILYAFEHGFRLGAEGRVVLEVPPAEAESVAVIQDDRWYIAGSQGEELYDMAADPDQHRNLAGSESVGQVRALAAERGSVDGDGTDVSGSAELRLQLKALGYAE